MTGHNCPPAVPVTYTVEGAAAGSTTSTANGAFTGDVQLPDTSIGEHVITVTCGGRSASVPIDLVVASSVSSPGIGATVVAILVFFVLFGSVLLSRPAARRARPSDPEQPA